MSPAESSGELLRMTDLAISVSRAGQRWRAVDGISLHVSAGEVLALVGESGCGKSLTALSVLGLLPQGAAVDSGRIQYKGSDLLTLDAPRLRKIRGRDVAMVFQEPMTSLNPVLTVGDQIAEAVRVHEAVSRSEARRRATEAMARVGIPAPEERYARFPHEFSGGMQQRVMIAMALVTGPSLLIADEPTTALDVTVQAQMLQLIRDLAKETGMGVLLITHDLGVVAEVADRVAVMYAGWIVETAVTRLLFEKPLHPYTRALYRALPSARPAGRLEAIPGRVPALWEVPTYCRFYDRCSDAIEECRAGPPPARLMSEGRTVRCVRA